MEDRVVKPYLILTAQPSPFIRYLDPCQYELANNTAVRHFYEVSLHCQMKNFNFNFLPNIKFYVCVSMVRGDTAHNDSRENEIKESLHPFQLKCSNSETRIRSEILLRGSVESNSFLFEIDKQTMVSKVRDLFVLARSLNELNEHYERMAMKHTQQRCYEPIWVIKCFDFI